MNELYVLIEYVSNHGEYEDYWHAERVVGVYSSFESAMQMVRVFKQSAIAFCSEYEEEFKFLELKEPIYEHYIFTDAWCMDHATSDIEATDFYYFIEKTTVDEHNLRFILPPWLQLYEEEE